jgi:cytochrome b involved in lipid metabolism
MAHLAPAGRSSETRCEGGAKDVDGQLGEKAYKGITWAQLAQHSTRAKPWLAIDGIVYDCTDFVDLHPGGKVLLAYAGTCAPP